MSNDLISRRLVMDYLREQQSNVIMEKAKENPVTYEATKAIECSISAFMNFIITMPTAYDADKVVEQLEKEGNNIFETHFPEKSFEFYNNGIARGFWKAEEIVKAGGVSDNH